MKKRWDILIIVVVLLCIMPTAFAAINNKYFRADSQTFDAETGLYTINGNIVITLGSGTIMGESAQVKLATLEFYGTGGWFLEQEGVEFRGENVYVAFNDSDAAIEGGAHFQRSTTQISSDKVNYNWKTKIAEFTGNVKTNLAGIVSEKNGPIKYNVETGAFVK